jgi:hypothetical protein
VADLEWRNAGPRRPDGKELFYVTPDNMLMAGKYPQSRRSGRVIKPLFRVPVAGGQEGADALALEYFSPGTAIPGERRAGSQFDAYYSGCELNALLRE